MSLKARLMGGARGVLHRAGFDLVRVLDENHLLKQAVRTMEQHEVDVVLDVGGNTGQWAKAILALGYRGRIISFEPLTDAYHRLRTATEGHPRWGAINQGLGEREGNATIHVSGNSQSSSMLEMRPLHREAAPQSAYVRDEVIRMTTLERVLTTDFPDTAPVFLKVDAQGYEHRVLDGIGSAFSRIAALQVELSLVELYDGELVIEDMLRYLRGRGFVPTSLEPNFWAKDTGRLLQVDGLFVRA